MEIRKLRADEIEIRIQSIKENGFSLLLYKDARCDMKIMDETFGPFGWQRRHDLVNGNLFCTVSIWDENKKQWISKQDVGVESYTEKEKGQASDSFKRACFNIGVGRELYTAPFMWIAPRDKQEIKNNKNKFSVYTKFSVSEIEYNGENISKLVVIDDKDNVRFSWENGKTKLVSYTKDTPNQEYKQPAQQPIQKQEQPNEKDIFKSKIVRILNEKNISFDRMVDYLANNYRAKTLNELNENQLKILEHKVKFEWS